MLNWIEASESHVGVDQSLKHMCGFKTDIGVTNVLDGFAFHIIWHHVTHALGAICVIFTPWAWSFLQAVQRHRKKVGVGTCPFWSVIGRGSSAHWDSAVDLKMHSLPGCSLLLDCSLFLGWTLGCFHCLHQWQSLWIWWTPWSILVSKHWLVVSCGCEPVPLNLRWAFQKMVCCCCHCRCHCRSCCEKHFLLTKKPNKQARSWMRRTPNEEQATCPPSLFFKGMKKKWVNLRASNRQEEQLGTMWSVCLRRRTVNENRWLNWENNSHSAPFVTEQCCHERWPMDRQAEWVLEVSCCTRIWVWNEKWRQLWCPGT